MTEGSYRRRLEQDLRRWEQEGWVTPDGITAILGSLQAPRPAFRMSGLVAVLGALLLSVGVIGLVAANWEAIPRLLRFWLLVATMAVSYGAAAFLHGRRHPLYAEAAFLLSGLVFAASIALVGQAYHLAGEFSDAVLMWSLGCVAASLLTRSAALAALAAAGSAFWTGLLAETSATPHLPSLVFALGVLALGTWIGSRFARAAAILSLGLWVVVAVVTAARVYDWMPGGAMALLAALSLGFWMLGAALQTSSSPRIAALGSDLLVPALPTLLVALGFLQVAPRLEADGAWQTWLSLALLGLGAAVASGAAAWKTRTITALDLVVAAALGGGAMIYALWLSGDGFIPRLLGSVLVLVACLWTVSLGYRGIHRAGRSLGLAAFALEVAYIYALTFGTVLDTALALLGGGALFLLVAVALVHIDRRLSTARAQPMAGARA